jgi:hypothetical protein
VIVYEEPMKSAMNSAPLLRLSLSVFLFSYGVSAAPRADLASVVVDMNELALASAKSAGLAPPLVARTLAMMHLGFLDIHRLKKDSAQDRKAAEIEFGRLLLESTIPSEASRIAREVHRIEEEFEISPSERSARIAEQELETMLEWRASDKKAMAASTWKEVDDRHWNPIGQQVPVLPNWGIAMTFLEGVAADWRIEIPSVGYPRTTDDRVSITLELGENDSLDRTPEMTEIALFWAQGAKTVTPPGQWNRIAQDAAVAMGLNHGQQIGLFAELNIALAEVSVHCWANKYDHLVLRPTQVARLAGKKNWVSFLETPPHPEYPSGHSSFSAAAAEVLESWAAEFGMRLGAPGSVRITSEDLPGVTRKFRGFREAAAEAGMSRVYGGIHFLWSDSEGQKLGREIAIETIRTLNR